MAIPEPQRPAPLPEIGDDFDWQVRDYDGFRLFMLEELAARFPERRRWTPADIEVVIVEVLAAVLDQLSDMADRVAAEAYLDTARLPKTVYRWLKLIGYDAVQEGGVIKEDDLLSRWSAQPELMEAARVAGPRAVRQQRRLVTTADYAQQLQQHPLVVRTHAWQTWGGSWPVIWVVLRLWKDDVKLDTSLSRVSLQKLATAISQFHTIHGLDNSFEKRPTFTPRKILDDYIEAYRLSGQEVVLLDAVLVTIKLEAAITLKPSYSLSEVKDLAEQALGNQPGGFFAPGRLHFGESIALGDMYQVLTGLAGVENVSITGFQRSDSPYKDQIVSDSIRLERNEIAYKCELTVNRWLDAKGRTL